MYDLLRGLRVVEASAFVAAPSCALHLAQFGAEVVRIDQIGGGPDFRRWPLDPSSGASFYWEGHERAGYSKGKVLLCVFKHLSNVSCIVFNSFQTPFLT